MKNELPCKNCLTLPICLSKIRHNFFYSCLFDSLYRRCSILREYLGKTGITLDLQGRICINCEHPNAQMELESFYASKTNVSETIKEKLKKGIRN